MIVRFFILVGLILLLKAVDMPLICAFIYAAGSLTVRLILGTPTAQALLYTGISFLLACVYFYLLQHFLKTRLYWVILIIGLAIIFI
jgi:hypothetical protein